MPLFGVGGDVRVWLDEFIRRAVAAADTTARLVTGAIKSARYDRPKDARGDYGFVAERFYRDTEQAFHAAVRGAATAVEERFDGDDPTFETRRRWVPVLEEAALRLFDEYAPSEGLEDRVMVRHVKARHYLALALRGGGRAGKSLFEGDLGIPSPETTRSRKRELEEA